MVMMSILHRHFTLRYKSIEGKYHFFTGHVRFPLSRKPLINFYLVLPEGRERVKRNTLYTIRIRNISVINGQTVFGHVDYIRRTGL